MVGFIFQLLLVFLFVFFYSYINDTLISIKEYSLVLFPWLFTIWATHKHKPKFYQKKLKYILAPFFRAYIVLFLLSILLLFLFGIANDKIKLIIISLILYVIVEGIIYIIIIKTISDKANKKEVVTVKKYTQEKFNIKEQNYVNLSKIDNTLLSIEKTILSKLYSYKNEECTGIYSIDDFETHKVDLAIFNQKLNNIKDINKFFSLAYERIKIGGYIIIGYKDLDDIELEISKLKGLVKFFKNIKYYIFYRAFPKLPILNKIHSLLTNDKKKVISKTEVWGRLMYCGFDVKSEAKENNITFLIAQKDRTPSENPNPSFSLLIRLNRVSLYGHLIKIYKVRSMYPYSEFLQEKVYEMNSLTATGKFSEDFRITKLGKIYRKYWLDELPQFLDWFRGSIKLVGIRAMSQHFFSLYSKEYQEFFHQVKPGIISPIFDEKTDSFEIIQKIEQEYLEKYLKNPLKTDIEYFFNTLKHILKGVRSK